METPVCQSPRLIVYRQTDICLRNLRPGSIKGLGRDKTLRRALEPGQLGGAREARKGGFLGCPGTKPHPVLCGMNQPCQVPQRALSLSLFVYV